MLEVALLWSSVCPMLQQSLTCKAEHCPAQVSWRWLGCPVWHWAGQTLSSDATRRRPGFQSCPQFHPGSFTVMVLDQGPPTPCLLLGPAHLSEPCRHPAMNPHPSANAAWHGAVGAWQRGEAPSEAKLPLPAHGKAKGRKNLTSNTKGL